MLTPYEYHKRWVKKYPEKRRKQKRRWYLKNAQRIKMKNASRTIERVEYNKRYYEQYPEKLRERTLRYNHGITLIDYNNLLEKQKFQCAICDIKASNEKRLHVDHDHESGIIRGLLCGPCNRMIGLAKESTNVLIRASQYLSIHGRRRFLI